MRHDMETIRELTSKDLARISCSACNGCGQCCTGMGDTIHLDPWDTAALCAGLGADFTDLLENVVGLHVENGLILPHLLMREGSADERCVFLDDERRCGIHTFRPGICRLFPLGRNYHEPDYGYFVVEGGCEKPGKTKVRIDKWLGIPALSSYERFVADWHFLVRALQEKVMQGQGSAQGQDSAYNTRSDASYVRDLNRFFLGLFYEKSWPAKEASVLPGAAFYEEFYARLEQFRSVS